MIKKVKPILFGCDLSAEDFFNFPHNFHEKINNPPSNLANAAVYILDGEVVKAINDRKLSDFSTEVIPIFMGQINTWNNNLYHIDIGTPEALAIANENAIKLL